MSVDFSLCDAEAQSAAWCVQVMRADNRAAVCAGTASGRRTCPVSSPTTAARRGWFRTQRTGSPAPAPPSPAPSASWPSSQAPTSVSQGWSRAAEWRVGFGCKDKGDRHDGMGSEKISVKATAEWHRKVDNSLVQFCSCTASTFCLLASAAVLCSARQKEKHYLWILMWFSLVFIRLGFDGFMSERKQQ